MKPAWEWVLCQRAKAEGRSYALLLSRGQLEKGLLVQRGPAAFYQLLEECKASKMKGNMGLHTLI